MKNYKDYSWSNTIPFFTVILLFVMMFSYVTVPVFLILFVLKLIGVVTCSWWLVWLPIYYFIPLCGLGFLLDLLRLWLKREKK